MNFTSDNTAPVAPSILQALLDANCGYMQSYGEDTLMQSLTTTFQDIFETRKARVFLVTTGTAANALALATFTKPWQTIFCHKKSHIEQDECNATEFFTGGAKLTLLDGKNGKINPHIFAKKVAETGHIGVHNTQRGTLSITSVSELGTIYTLDEIYTLTNIAKKYAMPCHLDGARFANALVALGCTPAEMTWKAGFDAVSFGATKNGCLGVEAVIIFNPKKAWELQLRRKRSGHLISKHRYLSAQMIAYLKDDLWLQLARQANEAAKKLAAGLIKRKGILHYPQQANMLFAGWSRQGHKVAQNAGATYYPYPSVHQKNGATDEILLARLLCNWSTSDDEIEKFLHCLPC